jgi:hypothetical protein
MRFLIGFVGGIVAVVALARSASARRARSAVRANRISSGTMSRNLARYYYVSRN